MKKNEIEIGECYIVMTQEIQNPVQVISKDQKRRSDGYLVPASGWKVMSLVSRQVTLIKTARRFLRKCTEADMAGCRKR